MTPPPPIPATTRSSFGISGSATAYAELRDEVERAARGFLALGIKKGDRIGIWATNCAEWVVTQFATAKVGAILVNINPANRSVELEYALRQSQCQTLLLIQGFRDNDYVQVVREVLSRERAVAIWRAA